MSISKNKLLSNKSIERTKEADVVFLGQLVALDDIFVVERYGFLTHDGFFVCEAFFHNVQVLIGRSTDIDAIDLRIGIENLDKNIQSS